MVRKLDELTRAELKHSFRQLYYDIGFEGAAQVLYELIESGEVLSEVMFEELKDKNMES